jgi:aminotransferase EvaB
MKNLVPFNDTSRLFKAHQNELLSVMQDAASSGWWLLGKHTETFARNFAEYCGTEFCLPVANGTDALEIALKAVFGDALYTEENEVITVANAGGYTTSACYLSGASPVFADINEESQLIDLASIKRCLSNKVKAIVLTHLYGGVVDVLQVRELLNTSGYENVVIIEDCAQAHGAKLGERLVGSLGDLATFSFYPTKNLGAMGDGGALTTSDPAIYQQIKRLHQYGWANKYDVATPFARNSRIDEIQAGVLNILLPHLDKANATRIAIYEQYKQSAGSSVKFLIHTTDFVGHLAIMRVEQREKFIAFMKDRRVAIDIHYPILDCDQKAWQKLSKRQDPEGLKVSNRVVNELVTLPCFPYMTETEIEIVSNALREWEKSFNE